MGLQLPHVCLLKELSAVAIAEELFVQDVNRLSHRLLTSDELIRRLRLSVDRHRLRICPRSFTNKFSFNRKKIITRGELPSEDAYSVHRAAPENSDLNLEPSGVILIRDKAMRFSRIRMATSHACARHVPLDNGGAVGRTILLWTLYKIWRVASAFFNRRSTLKVGALIPALI